MHIPCWPCAFIWALLPRSDETLPKGIVAGLRAACPNTPCTEGMAEDKDEDKDEDKAEDKDGKEKDEL
jgi:hypothetical protein